VSEAVSFGAEERVHVVGGQITQSPCTKGRLDVLVDRPAVVIHGVGGWDPQRDHLIEPPI